MKFAAVTMAVMLGCTACGEKQQEVNQQQKLENQQELDNPQMDSDLSKEKKTEKVFYDGANLQGDVVEFTDSGFQMSVAKVTGDGNEMVQAAPGSEKEEELITVTYSSDTRFEILTMDKSSLTEISREDTDKQSIKKQTSVLVFGSCQDTFHWTADKVTIMRWN